MKVPVAENSVKVWDGLTDDTAWIRPGTRTLGAGRMIPVTSFVSSRRGREGVRKKGNSRGVEGTGERMVKSDPG